LPRPPGAGAVHFRRAVSQGHCARSSRPFQPQLNETALHRVRTGHFGESFAIPARMESTGILNAKAQRLRGAKRFFRLGVLATWRLCVEMSFEFFIREIRGSLPLVEALPLWDFCAFLAANLTLAAAMPPRQRNARRSRPSNRAPFLKSCSQILTTRHPCARSARFTFRSLARFPFNFLCHKPRFCRGCVPCFGQPCQKHPSTKTATRCLRNVKSGFPNKAILRRQPVT
jgi:hypothetical protein